MHKIPHTWNKHHALEYVIECHRCIFILSDVSNGTMELLRLLSTRTGMAIQNYISTQNASLPSLVQAIEHWTRPYFIYLQLPVFKKFITCRRLEIPRRSGIFCRICAKVVSKLCITLFTSTMPTNSYSISFYLWATFESHCQTAMVYNLRQLLELPVDKIEQTK